MALLLIKGIIHTNIKNGGWMFLKEIGFLVKNADINEKIYKHIILKQLKNILI
jgi:hypothetical protein